MTMCIQVNDVSKTFVRKRKKSFFSYEKIHTKAIESASFEIEEGEMTALVGANGAGKTTMLHLLCGLMVPDCGQIQVAGFHPVRDRKEYVQNIGVLFAGKSQLPWGVKVRDALEWNCRYYGIHKETFQKRLYHLTELLELEKVLNRERKELSLGEQMKFELVNVFLHEPKIVFLDEPTIGVDVTVKDTIRGFLKQMNKTKNLTMILTSHDQGDIEEVCTRRLVLDKGKIVTGRCRE